MTSYAKRYNNSFPLNGLSRWLPVDESVEGVGKAVGFFLSPLKALKKAVGKFLPNRWKRWKKPLGSFPLPVKSAEKSRWENSSYPLLQRRKNSLIYGSD